MELGFNRKDFEKNILKYKISWKSTQWKPRCSMADRRTDMTTPITAVRNFANAPKNEAWNTARAWLLYCIAYIGKWRWGGGILLNGLHICVVVELKKKLIYLRHYAKTPHAVQGAFSLPVTNIYLYLKDSKWIWNKAVPVHYIKTCSGKQQLSSTHSQPQH